MISCETESILFRTFFAFGLIESIVKSLFKLDDLKIKDLLGSIEICLRSSKILFFISFAELLVNVKASIFLKESSFPFKILIITLVASANVFPEPALALII